MNGVRVKSYAKINLTLDVLGASGGYHNIDSAVASIDLFDEVCVKARNDFNVSIAMHGEGSEAIPQGKNNAVKAAKLFITKFACRGADITIYKNIPMGAGLGGSSADVAGVLLALSSLYGVEEPYAIKDIADDIGSDCAYMLKGGFARMCGRGEKVFPVASPLKLNVGILLPPLGVSTGECYNLSDSLIKPPNATQKAMQAIVCGDKEGLCSSLSNGLTAAAIKLNPDVAVAIEELKAFYPLGVNMTGSGSGVYAIFENESFVRYAQSRYRGKFRFIQAKTQAVRRTK